MSTITDTYQWELNGLLMGHGTSYANKSMPTGLGIPGVRTADVARPQRHGEQFYGDYLSSRVLTFEMHVLGTDAAEAESLALDLKAAWAPLEADTELYLRMADTEWLLVGRPRGCEINSARLAKGARLVAVCRFECSDPRLYAAELTTMNATVPTATGGLTFPASAPFSFGPGGAEANMVATNTGSIDTPWEAVISGPCSDPRLELSGSGKYLQFDIELASGDTLELDSAERSVLLNGSTSRYSTLSPTSEWWDLPPGSSTMTFRAAGTEGSITVTYRTAYI